MAYTYDEYHNREGNLIALGLFALMGALMLAMREPLLALAPFGIAGRGLWQMRRARRVGITCDAAGFVVATRSWAAGRQARAYRWGEVTATEYVGERFVVRTAAGPAFAAPVGGYRGEDLVTYVNAHTPHLPYVWRPRSAEELRLGVLIPYTRAPRPSGAPAG